MKVLSQNGMRLVNDNFVNQYFIQHNGEGVKLMADLCQPKPVLLGEFGTVENAKEALSFIGFCLSSAADEDGREKAVQAPSDEDIERGGESETGECPMEEFAKAFSANFEALKNRNSLEHIVEAFINVLTNKE